MLLQNIHEKNVVGFSERDSPEAIEKSELRKCMQRPSKNDYDEVSGKVLQLHF